MQLFLYILRWILAIPFIGFAILLVLALFFGPSSDYSPSEQLTGGLGIIMFTMISGFIGWAIAPINHDNNHDYDMRDHSYFDRNRNRKSRHRRQYLDD